MDRQRAPKNQLGIEHLKPGENVFTWRKERSVVKTLSSKQVKAYATRKNPYSTIAYSAAVPKKVEK